MKKKLTVFLNQQVIDKAKAYAQRHSTSLSKLVEVHLQSLVKEEKGTDDVTPLVKSLVGVIDLSGGFDFKVEKAQFNFKKHQ